MKKCLTFIFALLLICMKGYTQCPPNGLVSLSTQEEVNNFPIEYPNCTEVTGSFFVGGNINYPFSDIVDLTPLSQITTLNSFSYIQHNPNLTSLAGLENLTTANSLFFIEDNDSLTDLSELQFTQVNTLIIRDNDMLTDLSSIANINLNDTEQIFIDGNDNLSVCNTPSLCEYLNMGGIVNIQDNAPGCATDIEVGASCNLTVNCPTGNVTLASQADVEEFAILYPDCTEVLDLFIGFLGSSTDITDLTPLHKITSVEESLWIGFNPQLTTLTGLNVKTTGDNLYVGNNPSLENLNGLDSLTSVGTDIWIKANGPLNDISALSNLTSVGTYIDVHSNPFLTNLVGLDNVDANNITDLNIYNNPSMTFCSVKSVCDYLNMGGTISNLYGNGPGCNDVNDILSACEWTSVSGNVFADENGECIMDGIDAGLKNWLVKAENDTHVQYTYTNDDGSYFMGLDSGSYAVSAISPNPFLWESICPSVDVLAPGGNTQVEIDFGAAAVTDCPLLEVDISAPIVRRCFTSRYYVNYCNLGTITAENAYVEVQLDPFFTYENSTVPGIDLGDNLYGFEIGNVETGECGIFRIEVYVDCDSTVLGQTHCMEAHIYPDSTCTPPALPLWDESDIEVDAQCLGDSIAFTIENTGTGDMSDSLEYRIIINDFIWQQANFQLNSGEQWTFSKAAEGAFHRLEAAQSPGYPGNSMPSVFVEGCGENANGTFNIGFPDDYPLNEGDDFISIDCQENVGSYDPNDKQAFPGGYGEQHYITDSTDLEYMIRFQNTGTDTAFNIVIRDTISAHLNIETLRPGVSSHDYRYDIEERTAIFTFENIMLPDSNVNEPASNGFIKFNIEQTPSNPIGTHIENNAAIYFDFNEPIITNTVFHTIGEDFMNVVTSVTTPPEVANAGISVNVFPNPFDTYTRFEVQGETVQELHLMLYDMMGRQVLQRQSTNQQHINLHRKNLPTGVYIFRLMDEKRQLATGKLIVK